MTFRRFLWVPLLFLACSVFGASPFTYYPLKSNLTAYKPTGADQFGINFAFLGGISSTNDGLGGPFNLRPSTAAVNSTNVFAPDDGSNFRWFRVLMPGAGGSPPFGTAGGMLTNSYPNPDIKAGTVGQLLVSMTNGVTLWKASEVNILSFGADPTGVTGSYGALTNALAYLSTSGGTIFFPPGNYVVGTSVNITTDGIIIRGSGQSSTRLTATSGVGANPLLYVTGSNFQIRDIGLFIPNSGVTAALSLFNARPYSVQHCLFDGAAGAGNTLIKIDSTGAGQYSAFGDISYNYLTVAQYGIVITNIVTDVKISNNNFIGAQPPNSGQTAIVIGTTASPGIVISQNEIEGWDYALRQYSNYGVRFNDNRTETITTSIVRWESGATGNSAIGNLRYAPYPTLSYDDQDGSNVFFSGVDNLTATQLGGFFARVGIGTTNNATQKLYVLGLSEMRDGDFYLSDSDVAHGMTSIVPTSVYGASMINSATAGGLRFFGLSDTTTSALILDGASGATPSAGTPIVNLNAYVKSGTSVGTPNSSDVAFLFGSNTGSTPKYLSIFGSGNVGVGFTSSDAKVSIDGGLHVGGSTNPGDNNLLVDGTAELTGIANLVGGFTFNGGATAGTYARGNGTIYAPSALLASDLSGTVVVPNGGTGATSFTANGVLYGNGTSAIQATTQGGANTVLVANAGAPSFSAAITVGTSVTSPSLVATTAVTTPSIITASGALTITPASGSGVNINLATTGDFIVNTDHLVVDTSTERVGINVALPLTALHVVGQIRLDGTQGEETGNGWLVNGQTMSAETSSENRLRAYRNTGTGHYGEIVWENETSTSTTKEVAWLYAYRDSDNEAAGFKIDLNTTSANDPQNALTITSARAVGLNTATPSARLSVNGGAHIGGDSDPGDNNLTVDGLTTSQTLTVTGTTTLATALTGIAKLAVGVVSVALPGTTAGMTPGTIAKFSASSPFVVDSLVTESGSTVTVTGTLSATTAITTASLTDSGLTSGRIPIVSTGGLLIDDADLTFSNDTLTATKVLAPTSVSSPALISTAGITATPAAGSSFSVSLSTTGDFIVNTDDLVVDTSAGKVGINTASPTGVLDIVSAWPSQTVGFKVQDGSGYGMYVSQQNTLNFNYGVNSDSAFYINYNGYQDGTTRFRDIHVADGKNNDILTLIGSTRAVGINTTSPSAILSVNGGAHIGGTSDPGDNNLLVDGTTTLTGIANMVAGFTFNGGASANSFAIANGTAYVPGTPTLASAHFANQGTTTTVLHGNASGNPSWSAVSLTADVTGTLPTTSGGTGLNQTPDEGDLLVGTSGNVWLRLGIGTTGQVLGVSGGTAVWQTPSATLSSSQVAGAGTDYTVTGSYAAVDFGTTDPVISLTAGTYYVTANISLDSAALGSVTAFVDAKLRNTTDSSDIANSERHHYQLANTDAGQIVLTSLITIASGTKSITVFVKSDTAAQQVNIVSTETTISYVKIAP